MKTSHYYTQNVRGFHGSRGVGARLRKLNESKLSTPRNRVPQKYHAPQSNFILGTLVRRQRCCKIVLSSRREDPDPSQSL